MIRTHAAALRALAVAASWSAACTGGTSAYRAGPSPAAAPAAEPYRAESPARGLEGPSEAAEPSPDRPGLGTEFGEDVDSRVVDEPFERASNEPFAVVAVHYNDAQGIDAQARSRGAVIAPATASTLSGGIAVALTDESGDPLPGLVAPERAYVVGEVGERYNLEVTNRTAARYELVASVDGLDVIDGRPAGYGKRGYIVPPHGRLTIEGFRTSQESVAAFRFAAVRDSYAARTGDDRNVGVVGFAFFAERGSPWTSDEALRRESADPFPDRYAAPPP